MPEPDDTYYEEVTDPFFTTRNNVVESQPQAIREEDVKGISQQRERGEELPLAVEAVTGFISVGGGGFGITGRLGEGVFGQGIGGTATRIPVSFNDTQIAEIEAIVTKVLIKLLNERFGVPTEPNQSLPLNVKRNIDV